MQRYFSDCKKNDELILKDEDLYHINTVMRMHDGDMIEVIYNDKLHICKLNENKAIVLDVLENSSNNNIKITLIVPLLKEKKMDYILQKATELGVDEIIPVMMQRCVCDFKNKHDKKIIRWTKICKEASEQSKRFTIPKISNICKLQDLQGFTGVKLVCSTKEKEKTIKKALKSMCKYDKLYIVSGPEGGLSLKEEKFLNENGFVSVSLGDQILRAETVPLFVLSVINYENME